MGVEGVVLAAGFSSRAGTYKMALDLDGKTVIERCIESMYDVCSRIIVVGGFKIEIIMNILNKYPKVEIVLNKDYKAGMFSSVKEAIKHVKEERFFFTPGDYAAINKEVYESMLKAEGDIIIPTHKGRKGHPVLMNSCYIGEILNGEYSNLKEFINSKGYNTLEVQDKGILMDIDTMEEYKKIVKQFF